MRQSEGEREKEQSASGKRKGKVWKFAGCTVKIEGGKEEGRVGVEKEKERG